MSSRPFCSDHNVWEWTMSRQPCTQTHLPSVYVILCPGSYVLLYWPRPNVQCSMLLSYSPATSQLAQCMLFYVPDLVFCPFNTWIEHVRTISCYSIHYSIPPARPWSIYCRLTLLHGIPCRFNPDIMYVILCITNICRPANSSLTQCMLLYLSLIYVIPSLLSVPQCKLLHDSERVSPLIGPSNTYAFDDHDILSRPFDPGSSYITIITLKMRPPLHNSHAVDDVGARMHLNSMYISHNMSPPLNLTLWSLPPWDILISYTPLKPGPPSSPPLP